MMLNTEIFTTKPVMTDGCGKKLSGGRMLSWFLFCAFVTLAPAAHAQDCTGPDGVVGDIIYNNTYDVFQGCSTLGWMAFHKPLDSPPDCPNIGDTCTSNGTIYAGIYEGHKYYVTAADAPGAYTWNNGTTNWFNLDDAHVPNCFADGWPHNDNRFSHQGVAACMGAQGKAFTAYQATFAGTASPYNAARYCQHLGKVSDPAGPNNPLAHGRDDWYLPAVDELEFIYDNLGPQPQHGFQSDLYWSSSEYSFPNGAWMQRFSDGYQNYSLKNTSRRVRCVAR